MSEQEVARLLGISEMEVARETEQLNPEAFATREEWINAHHEPRRSALWAEWGEEVAADEAENYRDEYNDNRRENG